MLNPIIERAARALFEYEPGPYGDCVEWAIEQDFGWRDQVDAVKLVLRAIREPSEGMLQTACLSHEPGKPMENGRECPKQRNARYRWQAMIDAALGE